jgi:hypothetical protein
MRKDVTALLTETARIGVSKDHPADYLLSLIVKGLLSGSESLPDSNPPYGSFDRNGAETPPEKQFPAAAHKGGQREDESEVSKNISHKNQTSL